MGRAGDLEWFEIGVVYNWFWSNVFVKPIAFILVIIIILITTLMISCNLIAENSASSGPIVISGAPNFITAINVGSDPTSLPKISPTLPISETCVLESACNQPGRPTANPQNSALFLADASLIERLKHRFILFYPDTGEVSIKDVDLSITGWDVYFGVSRFGMVNGTENILYDQVSQNIYFLLFPGPGGIAGWKPNNVLPDPPFRFAIYKTEIDTPNKYTNLYMSTAIDKIVDKAALNSAKNTLQLEIHSLIPEINHEIWEFNIKTGEMKKDVKLNAVEEGKTLIDTSNIRISSDGNVLYQLLVYGKQNYWTDQKLYLMKMNLKYRSTELIEISKGDGFIFGIEGLSSKGNEIAYYTMDLNGYKLWVKDITYQKVNSLPLTDGVNNLNLFISSDGNKLLVGLKTGWKYYDLLNSRYENTPIEIPFGWSASNRYIFGLKDSKYIVYDTEKHFIIEVPIPNVGKEYAIEAAQWH